MVLQIEYDEVPAFDDAWITTRADIWSVPVIVTRAAGHLASMATARMQRGALPQQPTFGERIYAHRGNAPRTVSNFAGVCALVEAHGFRVVDFDRYTVAAQISMMNEARFVIGEHGAGLANIVFCRPGAILLELFNPVCMQPAYWSVASVCGLGFGYLVCEHAPSRDASEPTWNTNYAVPLDELDHAIAKMTGGTPIGVQVMTANSGKHCMSGVRFTSYEEFEIDDLAFVLPNAASHSDPSRIVVLKDRGFIDSYLGSLPELAVRRAFGFGIWQGGSAIFLTKLLNLELFVCVDLSPTNADVENTIERAGLSKKIKPYFEVQQDNADRVREIIEQEFGNDPPDLIIDDASHLYEATKQSFQISFPYLKEGGYYVIENWSWAHWPENQTGSERGVEQPAMTNLIIELVVLLPSSDMIESISVRQGFVIVKKKASRFKAQLLNINDTLRMRGRSLVKI
jgi:hypothetical protein